MKQHQEIYIESLWGIVWKMVTWNTKKENNNLIVGAPTLQLVVWDVASYSKGCGFKFWHENWVSWLRIFVVFLSCSIQTVRYRIGHDCILTKPSQFMITIILSFDACNWENVAKQCKNPSVRMGGCMDGAQDYVRLGPFVVMAPNLQDLSYFVKTNLWMPLGITVCHNAWCSLSFYNHQCPNQDRITFSISTDIQMIVLNAARWSTHFPYDDRFILNSKICVNLHFIKRKWYEVSANVNNFFYTQLYQDLHCL